MRKIAVIMVLALTLLLMGLTLSASAVTILNSGETTLNTIINTLTGTTTYSLADLQTLTPAETLHTIIPGYTITYQIFGGYASFAGFTQNPGTNVPGNATATPVGAPFPTSGGLAGYFSAGLPVTLTPATNGAGDFGFNDYFTNAGTNPKGTKYTELALCNAWDTANGYSTQTQSSGLIFDVGGGLYIVAFEDGSSSQPLGDSDYNDLVLLVKATQHQVPLPPSALLLGSGLLGLVGLGWRRRNNA